MTQSRDNTGNQEISSNKRYRCTQNKPIFSIFYSRVVFFVSSVILIDYLLLFIGFSLSRPTTSTVSATHERCTSLRGSKKKQPVQRGGHKKTHQKKRYHTSLQDDAWWSLRKRRIDANGTFHRKTVMEWTYTHAPRCAVCFSLFLFVALGEELERAV